MVKTGKDGYKPEFIIAVDVCDKDISSYSISRIINNRMIEVIYTGRVRKPKFTKDDTFEEDIKTIAKYFNNAEVIW